MCKSLNGSRLRKLDLFGVPVGVTFKGEPDHKTRLGGLVTIFLLLLFSSNFLLYIFGMFTDPHYKQRVESIYTQFSDESNPWVISTNDTTLAGQVTPSYEYELPDGVKLEDLYRV